MQTAFAFLALIAALLLIRWCRRRPVPPPCACGYTYCPGGSACYGPRIQALLDDACEQAGSDDNDLVVRPADWQRMPDAALRQARVREQNWRNN